MRSTFWGSTFWAASVECPALSRSALCASKCAQTDRGYVQLLAADDAILRASVERLVWAYKSESCRRASGYVGSSCNTAVKMASVVSYCFRCSWTLACRKSKLCVIFDFDEKTFIMKIWYISSLGHFSPDYYLLAI